LPKLRVEQEISCLSIRVKSYGGRIGTKKAKGGE